MIDLSAARTTAAHELYELVADLYPICRSLTGDGVRETLRRVSERIPLEVHEVPTGTEAFDWTVPKEWNIADAHITDADGRRVVDFAGSNLHVVGYSVPVRARMPLSELRGRLTSIPEHPEWIPYRTSYYAEDWGFCVRHSTLLGLADGDYDVVVDSTLEDGHLTYGEYFLEGETTDEVLISTHVCHPSLANDNLSGIAIAALLAEHLTPLPRRLSYRFLFVPGTIGAIVWLHRNRERVGRVSSSTDELALLWVLNLSDGRHTLLEIANRSGLRFREIRAAADALIEAELLEAAA